MNPISSTDIRIHKVTIQVEVYFVRCPLEFSNLSEESPVQGNTQGPKASLKARDSKKPATPHAAPGRRLTATRILLVNQRFASHAIFTGCHACTHVVNMAYVGNFEQRSEFFILMHKNSSFRF